MNGVKILGHSVHPILIVFPLGLLGGSACFEIAFLLTGRTEFALVTFWMIVGGLLGGLVAALFGWIDWFAIPSETRAKRVGLIHGLANIFAMALFAASGYLRWSVDPRPSTSATGILFAGLVVALVGGWLGGELVERLGVGVHEGANVNAPSSLEKDPPVYTAAVMPKKV